MTDFNLAQAVHGPVRRLHHIQRYSSIPCIKSENVSAHSWQAALVGLLVARDLQLSDEMIGEVVSRCILHDISEAISGDIIRSYKHGSPEMSEACAEADHSNTYKLTRQFGKEVGNAVYLQWEAAKDDTLVGTIVKLADVVCVITYCAEEWHMGNRRLDCVLEAAFREIAWPMRDLPGVHKYIGKYIHQLFPTGHYTDAYDFDASWVVTWK